MEQNFHFLAAYLIALESFSKDFHYYCKSFGKHLYADEIFSELSDFKDTLFENVFLGSERLPLPSKVYLQIASIMTPQITEDDYQNLLLMQQFLFEGKKIVNETEGTSRGENAILDEIAGHLDKVAGLTFLQLRKFASIKVKVEESVQVEHCKACVQKAVDRAKATLAKIDHNKVANTVLDYEAKNLLVAEEAQTNITEEDIKDTLDLLSKKLGV